MGKKAETYYDSMGRQTSRSTGQDEDLVAAEKYNPALRGNTKSQDEVEKSGGLGALARAAAKKKAEAAATPKVIKPAAEPTEDVPPGATVGDQLEGIRKAKKGG
jgi:hypothetical protein